MKTISVILILSFSLNSMAISFEEAIKALAKHDSIEEIGHKAKYYKEQASLKGSWGDPKLKVAAKNFPQDNLRRDQTPMTGIEVGLSQKISLTSKYGNIKKSFNSLAMASEYDAKDRIKELSRILWNSLIIQRKVKEELKILKENKVWISKILKVSKRLYSTGKSSQQAILEIQIRKSEIETEISNKSYELLEVDDEIIYLVGSKSIDLSSIPWGVLDVISNERKDFREMSLKERLKARDLNLSASKLNYIPDLTLFLGVTKRSNIDGNGDFVSASVSFPLPFSSEKYSKHGAAVQDKYSMKKKYQNFERVKQKNISRYKKQIDKLSRELKILKSKTVKYAKNSRAITSKSYGLGNSTYIELLQSELKLQKILLHKVMLKAKKDMSKVALKYILGEPLNG
jgi:outer membrane protein TolC